MYIIYIYIITLCAFFIEYVKMYKINDETFKINFVIFRYSQIFYGLTMKRKV